MQTFKNFQNKEISLLLRIISKFNIKLLITIFCLIFIGTSIYGNFDSLANQTITLKEILWLSGGVLFSFFSIIINAYAWKLLIDSTGCNSNKLNVIKVFLITNIYKYLPGGIWHFVSRFNALKLKFSIEKSAESILLEPLLMLVAGLIFIPFGSFNIIIFILCWSSTLVFLNGFREFIIKKLKMIKASIFIDNDKQIETKYVQNIQNIKRKTVYPYNSLLVEIIFIFVRFLGFLCCIYAFNIGSIISPAQLISYFSLAWIIGLIVPAAPGGLGVFESVILFNLGTQMPEAPLLSSLLCYRLVSTISDICAALVYPVKKLFKF